MSIREPSPPIKKRKPYILKNVSAFIGFSLLTFVRSAIAFPV
ncbi:hypothetical protein [Carnobacterium pleistocenium]|nr:hypothetical protein [Carnobacterium pleistocenium]